MLELFETNPEVNVQESEYQRLLGFPKNYSMSGRMRELADAARRWYAENGRPWIYAREIDALELADGKLRVGGTEFSSKPLHDQFAEAQADSAVLVAVSAGGECEERAQQLWQESQAGRVFFHGNVRLGGRRTSGHGRQRPHLRLGGPARRGGAAALQSGLFRLGHFGPDQIVEFAPAKRRATFRRQSSRCWKPECSGQKNRCWPSWASRAIWKRRGASPD